VKDDIDQALAPLVGLPMWAASRTADRLTLQFGERQRVVDDEGGEREVGLYALDVACPWRLAAPDRILVGSGDLLTPADPEEEIETFDWDVPGASWLDVRLEEVAAAHASSPPAVAAIDADPFGGVRLTLSGALALELFPTSTPTGHVATEFWRLLRLGAAEPHFVVGTFGVELESAG